MPCNDTVVAFSAHRARAIHSVLLFGFGSATFPFDQAALMVTVLFNRQLTHGRLELGQRRQVKQIIYLRREARSSRYVSASSWRHPCISMKRSTVGRFKRG